MEISPSNDFTLDIPFLCFAGTPRRDGQGVVRFSVEQGFLNIETSLECPARRTVVRPVGASELVRIAFVKRRKVFLNSASQVVIFEPARINHGKPKAASMTRVVIVDVQNLLVHP